MPLRTLNHALATFHVEVVAAIRSAVKQLLEEKHLYQSTTVDVAAICAKHLKSFLQGSAPTDAATVLSRAPNWIWRLRDDEDSAAKFTDLAHTPGMPPPEEFLWQAPDIKCYCAKCERDEPFNLFSAYNLLPRNGSTRKYFAEPKGTVQVFSIALLCQSCKTTPEVFLLRRAGPKLTLSGRAPMETTQTPKHIPPAIAKYYSSAQIAYQSGQTLAALFMLRTTCEQWCRSFGAPNDKADVCLEKYSQSLPGDFRDRFPSLKTIYGELSAAIHSATADEELFRAKALDIAEHFEARKVFKLKNEPIPTDDTPLPGNDG